MSTFRNVSSDAFSNYEKVALTRDFNAQENEFVLDWFLYLRDLTNLAKEGNLLQKPQETKLH